MKTQKLRLLQHKRILIKALALATRNGGSASPEQWLSTTGHPAPEGRNIQLPFAIMGMLVVYCLKDASFLSGDHGIPELISCAVVILLHIRKRNTLLSIGTGTLCYMLLIQLVF